MFIDLIVAVLLVLALYKGWRKGFIVGVFSFLAFIIGLAAAIKLSTVAAAYIGEAVNISQRWLPVVAFAVVFLVIVLLVRLGAKALEGVVTVAMLGWANKLGGIILFAILYLFIFSILLFYATQVHLIHEETAKASVTYAYLQPMGPKVINGLGVVLPFFKNMFGELLQFFDGVGSQAATA
ncbi:CvpA family protein [Flavisolibacter tropicus]|uniref:Colicin V production protein n=1 Tax=Flavisolibacter tropicus TaxID=1492898 RepID=A0A172TX33_9BACT|nr:CvpA family protein [Flavisolibacter tropicus]ANE51645.1 colicin V production protein [Flavisolibacter tropicus]